VTGALFSGDAMQMMLVSFLMPAARCAFELNTAQGALIASIVFLGMFVGSYVCGVMADRIGRRAVFLGAAGCCAGSAIFSAMSISYEMLLLGQFLSGLGIGGVPVAFSLFAEFIPAGERGQYLVALQVFWTIGALFEAALAWVIMPTLGWRWLLVASATPSIALLIFNKYVPESPRWQASMGKNRVAVENLQNVAYQNGVEWTLGEYQDLQVTKARESEASFLDLFDDGYGKLTLVLWTLWLSCTLLYYGVILLSTQIFQEVKKAHPGHISGDCHQLETDDYARAFITTTAEIPSLLCAVLLVDSVGRKNTLIYSFGLTGLCLFSLIFIDGMVWYETFSIYCARAAANCAFTVVYISTGEMYPTAIRSTGLGTASAMARIGGFSAPFISDVLFEANRVAALLVFTFFAVGTAFVAMELPETGGASLPDSTPSAQKAATTPLSQRMAREEITIDD